MFFFGGFPPPKKTSFLGDFVASFFAYFFLEDCRCFLSFFKMILDVCFFFF